MTRQNIPARRQPTNGVSILKDVIWALALAGVVSLGVTAARADSTHECQGNSCNGGSTATAIGGNATAFGGSATATGVGVGIGGQGGRGGQGGTGGAGGVGGVASSAANSEANAAPVNVTSKSLSIGGVGLAASANACQGSLSVGPFGGTYSVEFCKTLAITDGLRMSGFSVKSQQQVLCKGLAEQLGELEECK